MNFFSIRTVCPNMKIDFACSKQDIPGSPCFYCLSLSNFMARCFNYHRLSSHRFAASSHVGRLQQWTFPTVFSPSPSLSSSQPYPTWQLFVASAPKNPRRLLAPMECARRTQAVSCRGLAQSGHHFLYLNLSTELPVHLPFVQCRSVEENRRTNKNRARIPAK